MRSIRRQNFTHVFLDLSLPAIDGKDCVHLTMEVELWPIMIDIDRYIPYCYSSTCKFHSLDQ